MEVVLKSLVLIPAITFFIAGTEVYSQQPTIPPAPVPRNTHLEVYKGDQTGIDGHAFRLDNFLISVKFRAGWKSTAGLDIRFENQSNEFQEFHIEDLTVVNGDGSQIPLTVPISKELSKSIEIQPVSIAPRAIIFKQYGTLGKLNPPFNVYFRNKLIAEII